MLVCSLKIIYGFKLKLISDLATLLAIIGARSIAIPLCPTFPVSEMKYIVEQSQASILLASSLFEAKALSLIKSCQDIKPRFILLEKKAGGSVYEKVILEESEDSGCGLILYTSGTTNRPVCGLNGINHLT